MRLEEYPGPSGGNVYGKHVVNVLVYLHLVDVELARQIYGGFLCAIGGVAILREHRINFGVVRVNKNAVFCDKRTALEELPRCYKKVVCNGWKLLIRCKKVVGLKRTQDFVHGHKCTSL